MSEINEVQVTLTANETTETTGWPWPRFPRSDDPSVGVDQRTYDNLVRYTKYASGAYQLLCPRPMGNTLIVQVSANVVTRRLLNLKGVKWTDTSLISSRTLPLQRKGLSPGMTNGKNSSSRSGGRQTSPASFLVRTIDVCLHLNGRSLGLRNADACIILVSLQGPGLPPLDPSAVSRSTEPRVHVGFLLAYNSIAQTVLDKLESQLRTYPSYNIVVCGNVNPHYCRRDELDIN